MRWMQRRRVAGRGTCKICKRLPGGLGRLIDVGRWCVVWHHDLVWFRVQARDSEKIRIPENKGFAILVGNRPGTRYGMIHTPAQGMRFVRSRAHSGREASSVPTFLRIIRLDSLEHALGQNPSYVHRFQRLLTRDCQWRWMPMIVHVSIWWLTISSDLSKPFPSSVFSMIFIFISRAATSLSRAFNSRNFKRSIQVDRRSGGARSAIIIRIAGGYQGQGGSRHTGTQWQYRGLLDVKRDGQKEQQLYETRAREEGRPACHLVPQDTQE